MMGATLILALAMAVSLLASSISRLAKGTHTSVSSLSDNLSISRPTAQALTVMSVVIELSAGVGVVAGLVSKNVRILQSSLVLATAILATYFAYVMFVLLYRPGGTCGCDETHVPATVWTAVRTGSLFAAPLIGVIQTPSMPAAWSDASPLNLLQILVAAVALATLNWYLPAAMHTPNLQTQPAMVRSGGA